MARLKQLASDTVLYGISTVVSRFLNYLLVPFYTAYFNPDEYGIVGLIYGAMIFMNVIFTFGMESAYLRYGAEKESRKHVFQQIQAIILFVSVLLGFLLWLLNPMAKSLLSLSENTGYLYEMMLGIIVLDAISIVPFADLRLERRALLFMILRVCNVLINIGLNFYLILVKSWGIEAVLVSNLIASLFSTVASWVFTFKGFRVQFQTNQMKTILLFGLPYIPAGIGYAINEVLDRFLINRMELSTIEHLYGIGITAETLTGIYNACYKLGIFMMLFIQMFRMAWQPFYMNHHTESTAKKTFELSFVGIHGIAGIAVLIIGLFRQEIAALPIPFLNTTLIDHRYWTGLTIVPFLLIAYWFQLWYTHFTAGIVIAEKTGVLPKATLLGAFITIVANLVFIPIMGLNGAALATLLSYMTMSFYMLYQSKKNYPLDYLWKSALVPLSFIFVILMNSIGDWVQISVLFELLLGFVVILTVFIIQWKTLSKTNSVI